VKTLNRDSTMTLYSVASENLLLYQKRLYYGLWEAPLSRWHRSVLWLSKV